MTLNDIPTDMIERVEVYKGIVPYKFGGNAMGGAVNVVLKDYPPLYGDVGYEISSFNTHRLNTVLKRTNKKLGLEYGCGGLYTHSDNSYKMRLMNIDDRRVRRDHDKFDKYVVGGSMIATKWWFDEIKMELSYIHNKQEIQGIDYDIREAYNKSDMLVNTWILKKKDFLLSGLDFDYNFLASLVSFGKKDIAKNRYDWDGNKYAPVSAYGGEMGSFPTDGDNRSQNYYSKLNLNYILNKTHSFNLNLYGNYIYQNPKDELMDKALGFKANFPNRMGSVTTGFSYDLHLLDGRLQSATTIKNYHYRTKTKMSDLLYLNSPQETRIKKTYWGWSEAVRYKFTKECLVKASFSHEMRIPTNEELVGNGYSVFPSPSLTPEKNKAVNIGLLYHKNTGNGIVEAEINGFASVLEDMIRFTPDMLPTMARYRNFGKVTTKGVEGEIKGDVCSWLYLYANATYQDLRDVRKTMPGTSAPNPSYNLRMPNIPYFLANGCMEIHKSNLFGGSGQNTRFLLDASYIHDYFYDFEMSKNQERKIPASLTFDGAIEHSFMNNRLFITLKIKNITDREIYSELNRPLPGRQLGIKMRYLFK